MMCSTLLPSSTRSTMKVSYFKLFSTFILLLAIKHGCKVLAGKTDFNSDVHSCEAKLSI